MTTSIIGLFESGANASKVQDELTKAGFKKDTVEILQDVAASNISSRLVEAGYEKVEAERTRVDRVLKPEEADKAFQEGTVEVTATTEKPVVSKQAHVVEEVSLSKQSGEREVTVSGTVRRQDVKVEEIDGKSGKAKTA